MELKKEISTQAVVAIISAFLSPVIIAYIAKANVEVALVTGALMAVAAFIVSAVGTTISVVREALTILADTTMTPEEKLPKIQVVLVRLVQNWELNWQKLQEQLQKKK